MDSGLILVHKKKVNRDRDRETDREKAAHVLCVSKTDLFTD